MFQPEGKFMFGRQFNFLSGRRQDCSRSSSGANHRSNGRSFPAAGYGSNGGAYSSSRSDLGGIVLGGSFAFDESLDGESQTNGSN